MPFEMTREGDNFTFKLADGDFSKATIDELKSTLGHFSETPRLTYTGRQGPGFKYDRDFYLHLTIKK